MFHVFFFSSRRRHTRWNCDWSSDVCSSDLFPALLLAISITATLGPQIQNAMIAIGVISIPIYARLTRGQVLSLRERDFVMAAKAIGVGPVRVTLQHLLPNIANPLIVQMTLTAAF